MQAGFAERIMRMAEMEQQHRHEIEVAQVVQPYLLARRGQILAFLALVVFLAFALWLGQQGEPVLATILAAVDLVALVGLFLRGQRADLDQAYEADDPDEHAAPPA